MIQTGYCQRNTVINGTQWVTAVSATVESHDNNVIDDEMQNTKIHVCTYELLGSRI
jgi:hypothetical protein